MNHVSTFEVLASDADQERVASTRAVIAVQTRVRERFAKYVGMAKTDSEREARIVAIGSDLDDVLGDVADEYNFVDIGHLRNAATVALGGGHDSDCGCGFCENKGNLPGSKKDDGDEDEKAKKAEKSDPESHDNEDDEKDDEKSKKMPWDKSSRHATASVSISHTATDFPWEHVAAEQKKCAKCGKGLSEMGKDGGRGVYTCSSCGYIGGESKKDDDDKTSKTAADVETGDSFQQETLDLGSTTSEDGLSETGSPKIDKKQVPKDGLKEIDVGSKMHPNEKQDVADRADYNAPEFDPKSPTRDRVDIETTMQSEHNVGPDTTTWTGTEGLADPVTSSLSKWSVLQG